MKPCDPIQVQQILAGGRELLTAWCDGYEYVRTEPAGTIIVKHTRGLFEGCEVRFNKSDIRLK